MIPLFGVVLGSRGLNSSDQQDLGGLSVSIHSQTNVFLGFIGNPGSRKLKVGVK